MFYMNKTRWYFYYQCIFMHRCRSRVASIRASKIYDPNLTKLPQFAFNRKLTWALSSDGCTRILTPRLSAFMLTSFLRAATLETSTCLLWLTDIDSVLPSGVGCTCTKQLGPCSCPSSITCSWCGPQACGVHLARYMPAGGPRFVSG